MGDLMRNSGSGMQRPSSSLVQGVKNNRLIASYEGKALELQCEAALDEKKAQNHYEYTQNRIQDVYDVLTLAKRAMRDEMDQAMILPIVQSYGMQVERSVRDYPRGH